jgi:hypothetical protein
VGGDLYPCGSVFVTDCTLTGNSAQGGKGDGGGGGLGGAVFNLDGILRLEDDTVDQNQVRAGPSGYGSGVFSSWSISGGADGSDVYNLAYGNYIEGGSFVTAQVFLFNDILADGTPVLADLASDKRDGNGPNLAIIAGGDANLVQRTDIHNTTVPPYKYITQTATPQLGPLGFHGGLTPTMAIISMHSPAYGTGDPVPSVDNLIDLPPYDQRWKGFARLDNGRLDLGAYESHVPNFTGFRLWRRKPGPTHRHEVPFSNRPQTVHLSVPVLAPGAGRVNEGHVTFSVHGQMLVVHLSVPVLAPGAGRVNKGHVTFSVLGQTLVAPVRDGTASATLTIPGKSPTAPGGTPVGVYPAGPLRRRQPRPRQLP